MGFDSTKYALGINMTKKICKLTVLLCLVIFFGCSRESDFQIKEEVVKKLSGNLIFLAQFSDDSSHVALIDEKRQVKIWELNDFRAVFSLSASQTPTNIRAFYYKKGANLLLIAGENYLDFWQTDSNKKLGQLKVFSNEPLARISSLAVSKHSGMIAVGMTDGTVFIYNRVSNTSIKHQIHSSVVKHIIFGRSDRYILTAGLDGKVSKSSVTNLEKQFEKKYKNRISTLTYDAINSRFFVSDVLKNQEIYNFDSGEFISKLEYSARFRWFRESIFLKNMPYIYTTSPKTDIFMWHINTGDEVLKWSTKALSLGSTTLDIQIDDSQVFTITSEGVFQKWLLSES